MGELVLAQSEFSRGLAIAAGILAALWLLISAARMLMFPRPEQVWITNIVFRLTQAGASWLSRHLVDAVQRHRVLGSFAPVALLLLPLVWSIGLIFAFSGIYWGMEGGSFLAALELSGSSLTTLGFVGAPSSLSRSVAIVQAVLGLAIVALVISFLPTFYGTFSRREAAVARLTIYAGRPSTPLELIVRAHRVDQLQTLNKRWDSWEQWFVELEETHTTFPTLVYFRSSVHNRSWLSAAETILDSAAMIIALQLTAQTGEARTMLRAGCFSLREIASYFDISSDADSMTVDGLDVSREKFESLVDELADHGVPIRVSRDRAWQSYAGWRREYDRAVAGLRAEIIDVPSHWELERLYGQAFDDEPPG